MHFGTYDEIVDFAIGKEKEAADFYTECAAQEPFSGSKKTLMEMAAEERKHQKMLENLDENRAAIEDYNWKWIPDIKRSDYMVEMRYEKGMPYADILRLAMKREEQALKLYNELQGRAKHPEHKKIFKMLCQEEAKHKLFLETLYDDFMAAQGD
ncbi:MAG: ferritin family protein [Desulfobacteraceae bacterium]|jgi:rubrerythrin|nr:ferritin family protein [Desulfobacteraceae bacterium]